MQLGLFYQIQVPRPWSAASESQRYWEMLEEVSYAEEIGMTSVWFVEHHFRSEWSHSSAPDLTLAAISQRTRDMRLGIAVVLAPLHHPLNVAARMATLDILSNGRVDLGIGRSGYPYQMQPFGADLADVSGMVEEYLKIIPGAWTQEEFSFDGRYYHIPPREVVPKPVQKPHPPIWQACSQDDTARKVGQQGLGCLAQTSIGPERAQQIIRIYKEAIQDPTPATQRVYNRVAGNTVAYCSEDRRKAQERGAELIDWYRHQQRLRDAKVWQGYDPARVPLDYQWHYQRAQVDPVRRDETTSLELIQRGGRFCIGNPDDCIEYIEQYEAMGVDEMMPLFQVGPVTHEEVMESLRLCGKYVVPHFQARARRSGSVPAPADN
jgi:alkanesulfonate monooxygenase SsuD/methylene tetrahydromethanopterin reductase-like flavin-dependent oxidoreductase (luciferase family)